MKKYIVVISLLLMSLITFSARAATFNGSLDFGGLINSASVDLPLITDDQVNFEGIIGVGNFQGDSIGLFGGHDILFANNSALELQVGTFNLVNFLTFTAYEFTPPFGPSNIDFIVKLLTIDSVTQPTNSGLGLFGTVLLTSSLFDDTLANIAYEISENGTYSASGTISSINNNTSEVPAPEALWLMLSAFPFLLKKRKIVQTII